MASVCPCGAQAIKKEGDHERCGSCRRTFVVQPAARLANVMAALADNVESLPDEQILADAQACGVDVEAEANRVRGVLLQPVQLSLFGRD